MELEIDKQLSILIKEENIDYINLDFLPGLPRISSKENKKIQETLSLIHI